MGALAPKPNATSENAGILGAAQRVLWGYLRQLSRIRPRIPSSPLGVLLALVTLLVGCEPATPIVPLTDWHLEAHDRTLPVHVPQHLNGYLRNAPQTYVLSTDLVLPPTFAGQNLLFTIPELSARSTLRVNGELAKALGNANPKGYRHIGPHVYWIREALSRSGRIHLRLEVTMASPAGAWFDTVPHVHIAQGYHGTIDGIARWDEWIHTFTLSVLVACFLTTLAFWLWTRRNEFAAITLTVVFLAHFPAYYLGLLQTWVGPAEAYLVLVALTGFFASIVRALSIAYSAPVPPFLLLVAPFLQATCTLSALDPFAGLAYAKLLAILINGVLISVYAARRIQFREQATTPYGRSFRRTALVATLAWIPDLASAFGYRPLVAGFHPSSLGFDLTIVYFTVVYAFEFWAAHRRAIELQKALEEKVALHENRTREAQLLTVELRRQLAANTSELANVLVRATQDRSPQEPLRDDLIDGRYRIRRLIGRGSMGTVHEAVRLTDGKVFALKLLQGPSGPTALTRFALEAETALRVQSPHVVSICDFGTTSEGQLFLVLEYVLGATLAEEENRFGDRGWALRILCQIAKGLEAIHKAGVVHRDVKPSNILLSYESDPLYPTAKITDFGVSALGPSDESPDATVIEKTMTRTGSLVGTPAYMAPEAYDGSHELDAKSDVFSFAIVAREILGSPSSGPEALPIGLRLTAPGDLTHETQFQGALDPETNAVLTSCLAKDPQRRPSAEAIRIALEKSLHGFQTGAWSVGGTAA